MPRSPKPTILLPPRKNNHGRVEASRLMPGNVLRAPNTARCPCHDHHSSPLASLLCYLMTCMRFCASLLMSAARITTSTSQRREGRRREFESIARGHTAWLVPAGFQVSPLSPRHRVPGSGSPIILLRGGDARTSGIPDPAMELAWDPPGGPMPHSCCSEVLCIMSTTRGWCWW